MAAAGCQQAWLHQWTIAETVVRIAPRRHRLRLKAEPAPRTDRRLQQALPLLPKVFYPRGGNATGRPSRVSSADGGRSGAIEDSRVAAVLGLRSTIVRTVSAGRPGPYHRLRPLRHTLTITSSNLYLPLLLVIIIHPLTLGRDSQNSLLCRRLRGVTATATGRIAISIAVILMSEAPLLVPLPRGRAPLRFPRPTATASAPPAMAPHPTRFHGSSR